jgi:hypothetical protein
MSLHSALTKVSSYRSFEYLKIEGNSSFDFVKIIVVNSCRSLIQSW